MYDLLGREVAILVEEDRNAGKYKVAFDGSWSASGVYLYRLESRIYTVTKKLLPLK